MTKQQDLEFSETKRYSHDDLVVMARKWLQPKHSVIVSEICAMGLEQPDAIAWDGTITTLIECKASRSDFLADRKKIFRRYLDQGLGDYRYYLAPVGVIKETDELPARFGWLEVNPMTGKIKTRVKAVHQPEKHNDRETYILLSLLRRIGQQAPGGCSIKCYTYETQNRTVLEVVEEASQK